MIKYLKKLNCKKITLGNTKTLYNVEELDLKEKNIEKFKSSFGVEKNLLIVIVIILAKIALKLFSYIN